MSLSLASYLCYLMQIVDEQGNECPVGVEGEIAVDLSPARPVGLFSRYVVCCK